MMKSVESDQPFGIGIDIAEIAPFRNARPHFLEMVFTRHEIERCRRSDEPSRAYALAWAAKEAATKAVDGAVPVVSWETVGDRMVPVQWRETPTVSNRWMVRWQECRTHSDCVAVVVRAWRVKEAA